MGIYVYLLSTCGDEKHRFGWIQHGDLHIFGGLSKKGFAATNGWPNKHDEHLENDEATNPLQHVFSGKHLFLLGGSSKFIPLRTYLFRPGFNGQSRVIARWNRRGYNRLGGWTTKQVPPTLVGDRQTSHVRRWPFVRWVGCRGLNDWTYVEISWYLELF